MRELYESGEHVFLLKLSGLDPGERRLVESRLGELEAGQVSLAEVASFILSLAPGAEIRAGVSFDPFNWHGVEALGDYTWPLDALVRRGLAGLRGRLILVRPGDETVRLALALYRGFGIALEDGELEPVAVFIEEGEDGPVPRPHAIVFALPESDGVRLVAYTASDRVADTLEGAGFEDAGSVSLPVGRARVLVSGEAYGSLREARRQLGERLVGVQLYMYDTSPPLPVPESA